jgi:hypothetical protein
MSEIATIENELPNGYSKHFEEIQMADSHKLALAIVREAIMQIDELSKEFSEDLEGLAKAEIILDAMRSDIGYVLDNIKTQMGRIAPRGKTFEIEGVGIYEKYSAGAKMKWDNDAVWQKLRIVAAKNDIDMDSFEAMRDIVKDFAGIGYWRVGAFQREGIDPDDEMLRDKIEGRLSVKRLTAGPKL